MKGIYNSDICDKNCEQIHEMSGLRVCEIYQQLGDPCVSPTEADRHSQGLEREYCSSCDMMVNST